MKLTNINKIYKTTSGDLHILKDINLRFESRNFYAIMGRSGSGKSTLVNILGLLDDYTTGEYIFDKKNISNLNDKEKSYIRGMEIGFIFQSFYLNNNLTALENVMLPLYINKRIDRKERKKIALSYLKKLGLEDRANHYPNQMSGGEQQRVAIARALVNNPKIIIADEPTGNLDSKNEKEVFDILKMISKENKIVIVVSHNEIIKEYCDVLYYINDGKVERVNLWI